MTAPQPADLLPSSRGTVRVIVIDDTPALRTLTKLMLDGTGFEVVGEAGDGLAGVTLAAELQPDLVLLDLAMPVMDGLEALPRVRRVVPDARIVIVSGFERRAMESQVVEAGADAYLQKGLAPAAVLGTLQALFPDAAPDPGQPAQAPSEPEPVPGRMVPEPRAAAESELVTKLEADLEELLYVVSHDLAEPVHVIKGFAERLARRAHTDEEGEFCEFIIDAAVRMQQLLDDLLEYARVGRGELPMELIDCRRLVDTVIAGLTTAITRSGGRVNIGELPRNVVASRLVLTEVLHNLISNGLKFARTGIKPEVRVEAVTTASTVTFKVTDKGIGIDESQYERIFQPFTRLNSRTSYPGTGVGLAVCRRLVERHGGRIWVEGRPDGTCFLVEVPV